ncbi:hypothetical protein GCM10023314_31390 [Algibacter agarivorans]|uniref:DUF4238 domain-containing protein n=1 Tax=Algibacter agarivorans TaxID=1109741 RepID=A0ABP9GWV8_9FLAO
MKEHPEIQKQHRLSQVYLKKFGHQHEGEWMVSVMKLGSEKTENVKVSEFTAEVNIFDLPFKDFETRRHFETLSGIIENDYNRLINNINNQKQLTPKDKDLLNNFVPNILCRTSHFRNFLESLIHDLKVRKKLFEEITLFQEDNTTETLLEILKPETHLNVVIGTLMNHLVYIFRSFKKVILKCPNDYGWLTSDNPVFIDFQNSEEDWILPIESEIYLPLSKDYCLFMFNENSKKKSNPLRNLKRDKVNKLDFKTFDKIAQRIGRNLDEYLIFYERYEPTKIRE